MDWGIREGGVCRIYCAWCNARGIGLLETQGWFVQCLLCVALLFWVCCGSQEACMRFYQVGITWMALWGRTGGRC